MTIDNDGLLKVDWLLSLDECYDYNIGAWLEVADAQGDKPHINQYISEDCLTRNESSLSVTVYTKNKSVSPCTAQDQHKSCQIIIPDVLEECKVYSVQIIPEYDSLRGHHLQSADIMIPPKVISDVIPVISILNIYSAMFQMEGTGSSSSESFDISVISSSDSLPLKFKIQSTSCAKQMTSLFVRIYPDGIETAVSVAIKIPRSCFKVELGNGTAFSMTLSVNAISSCPAIADWKPLQQCRQYKAIIRVEYSSKWKSAPFVWDKFMSSDESQGT